MADLSFLSWKDFLAGWVSGICSISVGYPLETIKVRQQTSPNFGNVTLHTVTILRHEGVRSFFKGLSYPLWTTGILNSLYFGFYGNSLRMIEDLREKPHYRNCCQTDGPPYRGWHWDCFWAGCIGGMASTVVNTPVELVKTILQADSSNSKRKPNKCLAELFKTRGLSGCYHGGFILFIRDVPTFGLYAVIYEHLACVFKGNGNHDRFTNIVYEGMAGGLSGVITWALAIPVDVIKSRYMSDCQNKTRKYTGTIDCVRKTYNKYGFGVFYRGTSIALIRAFPVNLLCFVTYEQTLKLCNYL